MILHTLPKNGVQKSSNDVLCSLLYYGRPGLHLSDSKEGIVKARENCFWRIAYMAFQNAALCVYGWKHWRESMYWKQASINWHDLAILWQKDAKQISWKMSNEGTTWSFRNMNEMHARRHGRTGLWGLWLPDCNGHAASWRKLIGQPYDVA